MKRKYVVRESGIARCAKCRIRHVAVRRGDKGFCTLCDPYHPIHLVRENERLYTILKEVQQAVRDRLPQSVARGAILRMLAKAKGPTPLYSTGTKGVHWHKPRGKQTWTKEERQAIGKRLREGREAAQLRKLQLENEYHD